MVYSSHVNVMCINAPTSSMAAEFAVVVQQLVGVVDVVCCCSSLLFVAVVAVIESG